MLRLTQIQIALTACCPMMLAPAVAAGGADATWTWGSVNSWDAAAWDGGVFPDENRWAAYKQPAIGSPVTIWAPASSEHWHAAIAGVRVHATANPIFLGTGPLEFNLETEWFRIDGGGQALLADHLVCLTSSVQVYGALTMDANAALHSAGDLDISGGLDILDGGMTLSGESTMYAAGNVFIGDLSQDESTQQLGIESNASLDCDGTIRILDDEWSGGSSRLIAAGGEVQAQSIHVTPNVFDTCQLEIVGGTVQTSNLVAHLEHVALVDGTLAINGGLFGLQPTDETIAQHASADPGDSIELHMTAGASFNQPSNLDFTAEGSVNGDGLHLVLASLNPNVQTSLSREWITVGLDHTATMTLTGNSILAAADGLTLGRNAGSSGTLVLSGDDAVQDHTPTCTVSPNLVVGLFGDGLCRIESGTLTCDAVSMGFPNGDATGTIIVSSPDGNPDDWDNPTYAMDVAGSVIMWNGDHLLQVDSSMSGGSLMVNNPAVVRVSQGATLRFDEMQVYGGSRLDLEGGKLHTDRLETFWTDGTTLRIGGDSDAEDATLVLGAGPDPHEIHSPMTIGALAAVGGEEYAAIHCESGSNVNIHADLNIGPAGDHAYLGGSVGDWPGTRIVMDDGTTMELGHQGAVYLAYGDVLICDAIIADAEAADYHQRIDLQDGANLVARSIDMADGKVVIYLGRITVTTDMSARSIAVFGGSSVDDENPIDRLEVFGNLTCMPREWGGDVGSLDRVYLGLWGPPSYQDWPMLDAGTLTCGVPLVLDLQDNAFIPNASHIGLRLPFVETGGLLTIDEELISTVPPDGMSVTVVREDNAISVDLAPETPGDVNLDGSVNATDLIDLLNGWGACEAVEGLRQWCITDVDQEGDTDVRDLLQLLESWTG